MADTTTPDTRYRVLASGVLGIRLADTKAGALSLRMLELDNVVQRYTSIIGVTSLAAGFAFSAMVELDHEEYNDETTDALWYEVHHLSLQPVGVS